MSRDTKPGLLALWPKIIQSGIQCIHHQVQTLFPAEVRRSKVGEVIIRMAGVQSSNKVSERPTTGWLTE